MEEKASILKKDSHIMRILVIWLINVDIRLFQTFIHLGKLLRLGAESDLFSLYVCLHRFYSDDRKCVLLCPAFCILAFHDGSDEANGRKMAA